LLGYFIHVAELKGASGKQVYQVFSATPESGSGSVATACYVKSPS